MMGFSSGSARKFNPAKDIPSLKGKVVLVTGGNSGLGKQSVLEFARHNPAELWLTTRQLASGQEVKRDVEGSVPGVNIKLLQLDLSSAASVRKAAKTFLAETNRLDILMLNAGTMGMPLGLTEDGFETHFGTNHIGHALFTHLLLPTLLETAQRIDHDSLHSDSDGGHELGVRVVVLSSHGVKHAPAGGIDFDTLCSPSPELGMWGRYGQSKLANALFARELARRHPSLTVSSVHPGAVRTNLGSPLLVSYPFLCLISPFARSCLSKPEVGVRNQMWAAAGEGVESGGFYYPVGKDVKAPFVKNDELAKKLWDWTETELSKLVEEPC